MSITRSIAALAALVLTAIVAYGLAQADPAPAESQTVQTASYALFPVDESGVTGHLQVVERVPGGTRLILTLQGIEEGRTYPAALYVGSCGPDRPLLLELEAVGRENDPFVGMTQSELTFEDLTQGEYFVYVFDGDTIDRPETEGLDVPALACGEVGLGAVAGQP
jgi:hypothetical protein